VSSNEPATARSALDARLVLSVVAVPIFGAGAVLFFVAATRPGGSRTGELVAAALSALTAMVALVDLAVLVRRRSRAGKPTMRPPGSPPRREQ
jgi:hypothetical protein